MKIWYQRLTAPTYLNAYKDGMANGMGLVGAMAFLVYFSDNFTGWVLSGSFIGMVLYSIWRTQGKWMQLDREEHETTDGEREARPTSLP